MGGSGHGQGGVIWAGVGMGIDFGLGSVWAGGFKNGIGPDFGSF